MSQYVDGNVKSFIAGEAIPMDSRVKLNATTGKVEVAVLADIDIGTAVRDAFADGDAIDVRLRTASGTAIMIASAAIARGAEVYTAAAGKVGGSATGAFKVGTALEAAAADGVKIEVLRNSHGDTAAT